MFYYVYQTAIPSFVAELYKALIDDNHRPSYRRLPQYIYDLIPCRKSPGGICGVSEDQDIPKARKGRSLKPEALLRPQCMVCDDAVLKCPFISVKARNRHQHPSFCIQSADRSKQAGYTVTAHYPAAVRSVKM